MSLPDAGNGQFPSRRIGGEDLSDLALDGHFLKQLIQDLLGFMSLIIHTDLLHCDSPDVLAERSFAKATRWPP